MKINVHPNWAGLDAVEILIKFNIPHEIKLNPDPIKAKINFHNDITADISAEQLYQLAICPNFDILIIKNILLAFDLPGKCFRQR